jgi:ligand-binding sensor domain-containing protein
MRWRFIHILFIGSFAFIGELRHVKAQDNIPLGTWRAHISFNSIHALAIGNGKIYAASSFGVFQLDEKDNALQTFTKLNGLSGGTITTIAYNTKDDQLWIGYEEGQVDVLTSSDMITFNPVQNISITGSKRINSIEMSGGFAYASTDYGVVVFNMPGLAIKETWRDLGPGGSTLSINDASFKGDSVFLASANGIISGSLQTNLLDFNAWRRYNTGALNASVTSITTFKDTLYAAISGVGVYQKNNDTWKLQSYLQGTDISSIESSDKHLIICSMAKVWLVSSGPIVSISQNTAFPQPMIAKEENDVLWIGDNSNGLISFRGNNPQAFLPNGPSVQTAGKLKFHHGVLYAVEGSDNGTGNTNSVDAFVNGKWEHTTEPISNITDIEFDDNNNQYLSSFGYGVEKKTDEGSTTIFNESNSTLVNLDPTGHAMNISSLAYSASGLWVSQYGASTPLHLLKKDGTWESFTFPYSASPYPVEISVDDNENVWIVLDPVQGGMIIYNSSKKSYKFISDQTNAGGLPSRSVRSIAVDLDGNTWVGTDIGVAYFFNTQSDAAKPIFENRYLLKDDRVTAIAVDGGNRKWMGTERGLWLFNPTGESLVYHFTSNNSPLLSDKILDVEIQQNTGEVFISTDKGLVSFQSDASLATDQFQNVKVFPNPILSNFSGMVGITGLASNAFVKITDISGKLVWQTQANGGMASWNVQDFHGRRASAGVYLVIATNESGSEHVVGKIAVVD